MSFQISTIQKFVLIIFILLPGLIFAQKYTYTTNADFDKGILVGLEHETVTDQLQLTVNSTTFPFIWVPNTNEGTVSKVDTRTGAELGRYLTGPLSTGSPSRTTVDIYGNCWLGNRATGTLTKIGLYENGQYVDRNGNGIIETSLDLDNDGNITNDELLPWGEDECVLYEVVLIPNKEGTYVPGKYDGGYSGSPGPRGLAIDAINNLWAGTFGTKKFYYINSTNGEISKIISVSSVGHTSYGAVMDRNGILWSSGQERNHLLRLDPSDNSFRTIGIGHFVYGLGIDRNDHLFIAGWDDSKLTKFDLTSEKRIWTKGGYYQSRGVAVTDDGDVWIANSASGTVTRWSNDGTVKKNIYVGKVPTGVAVDADGKVWVVNHSDEYIKRIDPFKNKIDLSKRIIGGRHYGYSDMTGIIARSVTTKSGTWTVIHDSKIENAMWKIIAWNSFETEATSIKVRVRSSGDQLLWSKWNEVENGASLSGIPSGRYLQIQVNMQIFVGDISPILYDLTIIPATELNLDNPLIIRPNPFTPNNDGANDFVEFLFPRLSNENYKILILDYNGKLVSELINESQWDGMEENGQIAKPGAYFCIVEIENEIVAKGFIGLAR